MLVAKTVAAAVEHGVDHLAHRRRRRRQLPAARGRARSAARRPGIPLRVPRPGLCTDNGAMVAALGAELVRRGVPASPLHHSTDSSMAVTDVVAR